MTNTLAYYNAEKITTVKSFVKDGDEIASMGRHETGLEVAVCCIEKIFVCYKMTYSKPVTYLPNDAIYMRAQGGLFYKTFYGGN